MHHTGNYSQVNQAMQELPTLASEAPDPARRRGHCERRQHDKAGESNRNVGALADVGNNLSPIKEFVDHQVSEKVQAGVKEGEQTDHPPVADETRLAKDF